ncbi:MULTISPECIES: DUF1254 domain-containing protein [Paraburkholderia]|uniref:DUF1254 domain-containing protein n=1 Tax=Paraburkholderia TaxID=1822464 RepID=UPI00225B2CAF|nr:MULTISPECIES: DUF1254 domain-containing protein [Paraburkholderia]MCX4164138.1 DUF1254 domain-containing protein [Paraburkholderia megapolitana]MDN7159632.1 DUF1254 domain-containing protein [Paraburkholderia sp. CHISQ3]MDQ6496679.1 DUF1254 domain-containing protein [Paraburkholderia megapolitana]
MIKSRRDSVSLYWTCASLAGLAFLAGCAAPPGDSPKSTGWIKDEVADSYVFGYPLVLMSVARDAAVGDGMGQAPVNTLRHAQTLPPVGAANPTTPSLDTLDSTGWLDVGAEPVIVSLPDSHGRYVDARALDMWTNVIWSTAAQIGPHAAGLKAQTIAFVGPGWQGDLPKGVTRVNVPTRNVWLTVRVQSSSPRDVVAVRKLQRAMRVAPLSAWSNAATAAAVPAARAGGNPADVPSAATPAILVAGYDANAFFGRLAQALQDNPPEPVDPHALKTLSDLGVTPGGSAALPSGASDAISAGLADGHDRVATAPSNLLTGNGWSWFGDGIGNYGPDYSLRAYAAFAQPGIGTRDDEVRATVAVDGDGRALNGANRYQIHFAPNQLPPTRGFWSITAYTKDGALGESAPAHLAVGDRNGLRRNRDGSVDVTVSAVRAKAANWLPVPRADFQLMMRVYAPKPEATDGSWAPPAVVRQ